MATTKSTFSVGKILGIGAAVVAVLAAAWYFLGPSKPGPAAPLRVSVPPFVDTAFTAVGVAQGSFATAGAEIELVDTTWENQYDLIAGGALDISMSTLDEFVNKDRNLRAAGKDVVFVLPAWQFRGLGFYARPEFRALESFQNQDDAAARAEFLAQFGDRKIVFPEGSVFDQAIRAFVVGTPVSYDNLQIINASLDSSLNSLNDPGVGIVAVGSQQRFEAERRGYIEAIPPEALGLDVITGFIVRKQIADTRQDEIVDFVCGWYATARSVTADPQRAYNDTDPYLTARGANSLTFEEYSALRAYNVLPTSPAETAALFFDEEGAANWNGVWDRSVQAMADANKSDQAPPDMDGFVAPDINALVQQRCP